jgi:DNA-binding MarR family transcriptional regulator
MQLPPALDPVFHQIVRTRLGVLLNAGACSFTELKIALRVTDGNLDAHLRKLSAAGYLHSQMIVRGRPQTVYSLSPSGRRALAVYVSNLKAIIEQTGNNHRLPRR